MATKRRARTKGRFEYIFGPGRYYQPGLMGGPGRVVYAGTLWSRLVKRTVTKDPYPFVSLRATGHLSRTVTPAGLKAWTKAQFSTSVSWKLQTELDLQEANF